MATQHARHVGEQLRDKDFDAADGPYGKAGAGHLGQASLLAGSPLSTAKGTNTVSDQGRD